MDVISLQIIVIAIIISIACGLLGVFLVLRKMSMMIDAISHTVLLGIVLAYMQVRDLTSPWLLVGATLIGLLTVILIEALVNTKRLDEEAATGTIFPLLFSIAVILITTRFRNTHLDSHAINGNLEFAAFDQLMLFGVAVGAKTMYINIVVLLIIIGFIILFFKELKLISFDKVLASALGISPFIIHYLLMTLVSLTAVTAFNAVGTIMVVAMFIGPAAKALLVSKDLKKALLYSALFASFNAIVGYVVAMYVFNGRVNIASTMATITLLTFIIVWMVEPKRGFVMRIVNNNKRRQEFEFNAFMIHVGNHQHEEDLDKELSISNIANELKWKKDKISKYIKKSVNLDYIKIKNNLLILTNEGKSYYKQKISD